MSICLTHPHAVKPHVDADGPFQPLVRRWPTAVGVVATGVSLSALAPLPEPVRTWVTAWWLLVAAVVYLAWGSARRQLGQRRWLTAQTAGVLAFAGIAIAAVAADLDTARYVLAAGWIAHAAWDLVHHHHDRVVPRWYAEACMVVDLCLATLLLTVGLV